MAEIKAIMDKHDIAGLVVLHTPGFGEHMLKMDPSYSSIKAETIIGASGEIQTGLRLKVNQETHPNRKDAERAISDSVNMVDTLCSLTAGRAQELFSLMDFIADALSQHGIDIDRDPGTHIDGRSIDN